MKLGILVNDIATEHAGFTTTRIAVAAVARGHDVWMMGTRDLAQDPDGTISANARRSPKAQYKTGASYLADLQGKQGRCGRITVDDLDILLLRNDPSGEAESSAWARQVGIDFGRVAMRRGVIVLNDPNALAGARNKIYLQLFPDEIRARTLVSIDRDEIKQFIAGLGGRAVLKPVQGSAGTRVFVVSEDSRSNTNQIIESLVRDGYVLCQEYVQDDHDADTRLFVMNGRPLETRGRLAAFRRSRATKGSHSFVHQDQVLERAALTPRQLRAADIARPKLVKDGMFLVAIDFVGDLVLDINVFSPGGLGSAQSLEKVNFAATLVEAMERKVAYMGYYRRNFDNVEMATL